MLICPHLIDFYFPTKKENNVIPYPNRTYIFPNNLVFLSPISKLNEFNSNQY